MGPVTDQTLVATCSSKGEWKDHGRTYNSIDLGLGSPYHLALW